MRSRIDKNELIKVVSDNRSNHHKIFEEAVEGYQKEAVRQLEDHIKRIKAGSIVQVQVYLPAPADHTSDYDRVIRMLEMSEDSSIELDEITFGQFVMDDWSWKGQFLTTNSAYSVSARRELETT